MSLSTYYLEYGRHVAPFRRRRRRRAYAPTSNAVIYDSHEKINSWVSFAVLYDYRAPLLSVCDHYLSVGAKNSLFSIARSTT